MAAPDFPASPTVGQTYTPTSGLTYRWDGQVWTTTGAPQNAYWTDTGTTLTPTDVTRNVTITTTSTPNKVVLGTRTAKSRLITAAASLDYCALTQNYSLNAAESAWVQDDTAQSSWMLQLLGTNAGDLFRVFRTPPAGASPATLLTISSAGNLTPGGFVSAGTAPGTGSFVASGGQTATRVIAPCTLSGNYFWNGTWQRDDTAKAGWYVTCNPGSDYATITRDAGAGQVNVFFVDNLGNIAISGGVATKSTGTTWANPSDERMKRDVADYGTGLAAICQLRPVSFKYNGEFGTTDDDRLCYGFVAQEVEPVMPECVGESQWPPQHEPVEVMWGAKVEPRPAPITIKTLDQSNVILALVNAVKELSTRVEALEK